MKHHLGLGALLLLLHSLRKFLDRVKHRAGVQQRSAAGGKARWLHGQLCCEPCKDRAGVHRLSLDASGA